MKGTHIARQSTSKSTSAAQISRYFYSRKAVYGDPDLRQPGVDQGLRHGSGVSSTALVISSIFSATRLAGGISDHLGRCSCPTSDSPAPQKRSSLTLRSELFQIVHDFAVEIERHDPLGGQFRALVSRQPVVAESAGQIAGVDVENLDDERVSERDRVRQLVSRASGC